MWRSRTIPCPHGTGRPACETVLLHHEQFKIPENLARFAVRAGMTGFVKKMGPAVKQFVEERRQRVSPVSFLPATSKCLCSQTCPHDVCVMAGGGTPSIVKL